MSDHNERACTYCGSLLHHESQCPQRRMESFGVQCPTCGVEITIHNAGGYRTYCADCAVSAALANTAE